MRPEDLLARLEAGYAYDPMYGQLCNERDQLKTENAKLREELADAPKCETCEAMLDCDECLRADGSHKERRRLSAENAKLREWCSDFWKWADPPFALKSGTFDEYMALVERAVELGVIK